MGGKERETKEMAKVMVFQSYSLGEPAPPIGGIAGYTSKTWKPTEHTKPIPKAQSRPSKRNRNGDPTHTAGAA